MDVFPERKSAKGGIYWNGGGKSVSSKHVNDEKGQIEKGSDAIKLMKKALVAAWKLLVTSSSGARISLQSMASCTIIFLSAKYFSRGPEVGPSFSAMAASIKRLRTG